MYNSNKGIYYFSIIHLILAFFCSLYHPVWVPPHHPDGVSRKLLDLNYNSKEVIKNELYTGNVCPGGYSGRRPAF